MTKYNIEKEIWKDIEGYVGDYQISNVGRVRSLDRLDRNGNKRNGVVKKPQNNGNGYLYVQLKKDGKHKNYYIHRLVAKHFINNIENKEQVNHLDGDKNNNTVDNLEWTTQSENMKHAYDNGLNNPDIELLKINQAKHQAKLSKVRQLDMDGNFIREFKSQAEAADYLGKKNSGYISKACLGRVNKAYGYKWEYVNR